MEERIDRVWEGGRKGWREGGTKDRKGSDRFPKVLVPFAFPRKAVFCLLAALVNFAMHYSFQIRLTRQTRYTLDL